MNIIRAQKSYPTKDGEGVSINRIAGFKNQYLDPYLMIDELKSENESDYIGGFPPHPHRGIETFTYILRGGFEHQDHMGNKKAIRAGDAQWMSTGRGVLHSEMPLKDAVDGLHGFQIWLNMPAAQKMNAPRYQDSSSGSVPILKNEYEAVLRALAGNWKMDGQSILGAVQGLAGKGAIADLILPANSKASLDVSAHEKVLLYIYSGQLKGGQHSHGHLLEVQPQDKLLIESNQAGLGMLVLVGKPIREQIAHMGPFVMNTPEELEQAMLDYQQGRFGEIV